MFNTREDCELHFGSSSLKIATCLYKEACKEHDFGNSSSQTATSQRFSQYGVSISSIARKLAKFELATRVRSTKTERHLFYTPCLYKDIGPACGALKKMEPTKKLNGPKHGPIAGQNCVTLEKNDLKKREKNEPRAEGRVQGFPPASPPKKACRCSSPCAS